jgi:CHRD domain/PEP-CTERM motif
VTLSGIFHRLLSGPAAPQPRIHCCLPSPLCDGSEFLHFQDSNERDHNPAFVSNLMLNPSGTVAGAEAVLVAAVLAGETYINIHTQQFPGGEIRGFLGAVPEPSTWAMMLLGFAGLGFAFRAITARGGSPAGC